MEEVRTTSRSRMGSLLLVGMWIGVATGLIEGVGLLLFQQINWERWGPMIHVSAPILWISPFVDLLLFSVVALVIGILALCIPRIPALRVAVVTLVAFAAFDWLTLTGRLTQRSCILLGLGAGVTFGRWFSAHEVAAYQFWKRTLPWVLGMAVLALISTEGGQWLAERRALAQLPPAAPGAPNVLVIVVDTLRADHLSSYGYGRPTSPNFDRLASQGVLFENAVSPCSWTFPSHVGLVTGRYPYQHGMGKVQPAPLFATGKQGLGGYPTIGEVLEGQGYRTGAFSANRTYFTGNLGFSRGFTRFEDYFFSPADMFDRTLFGGELMRIGVKATHKDPPQQLLRYGRTFGVRKPADQINKEVLRWIDQRGERPFFAFLNYLDVHDPYGAPRSPSRGPWNKESYDDGIQYVDEYIGRLMQDLESRGLLKNTLVILTSDHGESLGEHGLQGHGRALYWNLIHVPLAIWFPGRVPAGIRIAQPVTNTAIPATIMDLLGGRRTETFSGPALSLLWKDPQSGTTWPEPVSEQGEAKTPRPEDAEAERRVPTAKSGPMKSLVTSRWHLIVHKNLGDQLFDWVHDPGESNNLISTPEGRTTALLLSSRLRNVLAKSTYSDHSRHMASATLLKNGTFDFKQTPGKDPATSRAGIPVDQYYRIAAEGGGTMTIQVRVGQVQSSGELDPVLTIENDQGELLQTCRNPGDDRTPPPGVADATPEAYDDVCVNDDAEPGPVHDSKLELKVPSPAGSPVDLYLHIFDWNGRGGENMAYQIAVSGAKQEANGVNAVGQQVDSTPGNHKN